MLVVACLDAACGLAIDRICRDKRQLARFSTMLNLAYGICTKRVSNHDQDGIVENDKLKVDPFLGGTPVWRCAVKDGSITNVELTLCVRNSQAVAQSRPESNEPFRPAGDVRSQKNPFAQDNDAVEERRVAHDKVIEQAVAAAQVRRGQKLPAPTDDIWLCYKTKES